MDPYDPGPLPAAENTTTAPAPSADYERGYRAGRADGLRGATPTRSYADGIRAAARAIEDMTEGSAMVRALWRLLDEAEGRIRAQGPDHPGRYNT